MPCVGTCVPLSRISKRIYRSIKLRKIITSFEMFGALGQDANGKIMPQQDINNTTICWSQSGGYNLIASHMPKHRKLHTSTAGLLQGEITHIYPPHFCHHLSVCTVCDCAQTKEKSLQLRVASSRTDVLYFAIFFLFSG